MLSISQLLRDRLRWADLVSRFDERLFVLVLPETTDEAAHKLVEDLSSQLSRFRSSDLVQQPIDVKVRFGVTEWHKGDDTRRFLKRAERALQDAQSPLEFTLEPV